MSNEQTVVLLKMLKYEVNTHKLSNTSQNLQT